MRQTYIDLKNIDSLLEEWRTISNSNNYSYIKVPAVVSNSSANNMVNTLFNYLNIKFNLGLDLSLIDVKKL